MFSSTEKALLSVLFIPCAIILAIVFKCSKPIGDSLNPLMAGILFGSFVFKLLPEAADIQQANWSYRALSAFVMIGFCVMMIGDKCRHAHSQNGESANDLLEVNHIIDQSGEDTEYVHAKIDSPDFAEGISIAREEHYIQRRKQLNAILLIVLLAFLCEIQGLYLIYRYPFALGGHTGQVVCYIIDRLLETLAVAIIALHGMVSPNVYLALSSFWCLAILMSVVPLLSDTPYSQIAQMVEHPAMAIFYALCSGFIFYISLYFVFINRSKVSYCQMSLRLGLFCAGVWVLFVTAYFE